MDVRRIAALYAQGLFPMDEEGAPELPWWIADPRTVLELDAAGLAVLRRRVRRSVRVAERATEPWTLRRSAAFDDVVEACARPRAPGDGVWLSPRMRAMYRALHDAGLCHTFEVWAGGELAAGLVAVLLGRAALLESMFHRVPHAGNVLVLRTAEALAAAGYVLCDLQMPTAHTLSLGAHEIPRATYEARLAAALGLPGAPNGPPTT